MKNQNLKFVINVARQRASLFKIYLKPEVQDDAAFLNQLLKTYQETTCSDKQKKAIEALLWYEQYYKGLVEGANYDKRSDALNNLCFNSHVDTISTENLTLAEAYAQSQKAIKKARKAAASKPRKSRRRKETSNV